MKNLILFAPLIFSLNLRDTAMSLTALAAFAVFCLASSAIYVLNDIVDRENDRRHPLKRLRPFASGDLSVRVGWLMVALLAPIALAGAAWIGTGFLGAVGAYMLNNLFYSYRVKHIVLADVGSIAFGFVIRVIAGTVAIGVEASPWLIMCTIFLAFFLGFAKRRHELVLLEGSETQHRAVLGEYNEMLLDQLILISAACTLMSYALYTVSDKALNSFGTSNLIYTVPFVLFGLFRYLFLIHRRNSGGNPTKVLLTDFPLIVVVVCWLVACFIIIYGG